MSEDPSLYSLGIPQIQEKFKGPKEISKDIFKRCLFLVALFYEPFLTSGSNQTLRNRNSVLQGSETEIQNFHSIVKALVQCQFVSLNIKYTLYPIQEIKFYIDKIKIQKR